jgi:hypothetical protein
MVSGISVHPRITARRREHGEQSPIACDGGLLAAEIELFDARTDHLDVYAVLALAEHVLVNAARLWEHASPEHKRRPQAACFLVGLS